MERQGRPELDWSGQLNLSGWYHSFELPDGRRPEGVQSLAYQQARWRRFPFAANLQGKRLLDIGAWDGWFSFEAERSGALVTAVDCVEMERLLEVKRLLQSQVDYRVCDVYDLPQLDLPSYDYVLFLGILYHLRHPLLALEIVCGLTTDTAIVECLVTDAATWRHHQGQIPKLEFYELDELGGHFDNWFGPSVAALEGMCRAAGFAHTKLLHVGDDQAQVACYRRWPETEAIEPAPKLLGVFHPRNGGINFNSRREDYFAVLFEADQPEVTRKDIQLEMGPYGSHALGIAPAGDQRWQVNARVPPGLAGGWHNVRLRTSHSAWSNTARVAVGIHAEATELALTGMADASDWTPNRVRGQHIAMWVKGLPENADRNNVRVTLGGEPLTVEFVETGAPETARQVNARRKGATGMPGTQRLEVHLGPVSASLHVPVD